MITRKKILLVTGGFYPEISPRSFRATELAREFAREGHEVVVITKYREFNYDEFASKNSILIKLLPKEKLPAMPVLPGFIVNSLTRAIRRLLLYLFEYPGIQTMFSLRKALLKEKDYDLMISFATPFPVHWGVANAWSKNCPVSKIWIADCGDPYMFSNLDTFGKPFYFKSLELKFCKKCNYISIPFKEMEKQFYPEFVSKIRVIPQGFNFDEIKLYEGPISNSRPTFIFAGTIIPGIRDLSNFVNFLSSISKDFLFIVFTNQRELFNSYIKVLGRRIEINDYIDRLSLIYKMSKVNFLVNIDTILDNNYNIEAIPTKLIDYALSKRPILNLKSDELDKNKVLNFLSGDYSLQRYVDTSLYDIRKISGQFLALTSER